MKHKRILVFTLIVLLVIIFNQIYGWTNILTNSEQLIIINRLVVQNRFAAVGLFILLTAVGCVVLALPGVIFAAFASALFGPLWGTIACLLGVTLGAAIAFLAARYFLRDFIKPIVLKNSHLKEASIRRKQ